MLAGLTDLQRDLNDLAHTLGDLWCFEREFAARTKGKPFRIWNTLAWGGVSSTYRILLIDLAAWYQNVEGWLPRELQGTELAKLRNSKRLAAKIVAQHPSRGSGDPQALRRHHEQVVYESRERALSRLFGVASSRRGTATQAEVARLAARLEKRRLRNLKDARNMQAHRYGWEQSVAKIRTKDLAKRVDSAGKLLNDLRLLLDSSTYHLPDMQPTDHDACARDLVDLILVGTIPYAVEQWASAEGEWLWQKRDGYYAKMHSRHRKKPSDPFNLHVSARDER